MIDQNVATLGTIFCGAGRKNATLEITGEELVRVSGALIADLAKPA